MEDKKQEIAWTTQDELEFIESIKEKRDILKGYIESLKKRTNWGELFGPRIISAANDAYYGGF